MCGIVGLLSAYSNGLGYDEQKAFRDMVVVDSLRGFDSTGVFSVSNRGNVAIEKAAMTGAQFVTTTEYDAFNSSLSSNGMFAVGHNRAATRGTVNDTNAHPFWVEDNIILVQNGTYKGDHKHLKNTEVDTEAIAHVIHEHPNDIQGALKKINAAYCLVWYNVTESSLYILRNEERPLYVAYTKQDGTIFASEKETILLAASRNTIELVSPPYLIAPHKLLSWKLDKDKATYTFTQEDIDTKYDYANNKSSAADIYEYWGAPKRGYQHTVSPHQVHQIGHNNKNNAQEITIHTYVYDDRFKSFIMSTEEASEMRDDFSARNRDTKLVVEFTDYLPANDSAECKAWYMYGHVLLSTDSAASPVMYSMLFDKTENEVIEYIKDGFFYALIPGTPIEHMMKGKPNERVLTLFCANLAHVNAQVTNDQTH